MGIGNCKSYFHLDEKGYTLPELMITMVVASVIFVSVGGLIIQTNEGIKINQQRQHMIDNLMSANMAILRHMGQGLGMRWSGAANLNAFGAQVTGGSCFTGSTCGRVRQLVQAPNTVASSLAAPPTPAVTTLAVFLKEAQRSGVNAAASKLTDVNAVGVYYQHQTSAFSGVLWVTEALGPGAGNLRAGDNSAAGSSISFGNIVDVMVDNPDPPTASLAVPLRGVDIRLVMRVFNTPERDLWRFCRPNEMGASAMCANLAPYSEMDRTIHVVFRNNILGPPLHTTNPPADRRFFERVNGGLYFFDFNFPNITRFNSTEGF
ncbi:MAG: prepilin-type N-terminal cleavage/methylation domain-containing protein [Bdellovibrionaceae bacterium]|nr:prepilin-type N-terminal cleavage/methylation domain-containing protein [Bdellovibrionales bacterium]MCB9086445.1 prepilin-type N-terminal cleavage/methylation domain-containing protein [Pseudobdellovibrionaceae bacterium]